MQGNEQEYIMAIFPLIPVGLAVASAGISAYGKYKAHEANKPIKSKAFRRKANTGYMRKYMSDLQGRSADRARTELAMRPALRMIGQQQRQGQRQLAYQSAQQGLEGSGIEAQKQLALQAGTTQAVAGLGESVLNQQLTRARQMQAAKEGQRMKIAGQIGQREGAVAEANRMAQFNANEQYRQQQLQHKQQADAIKIQGLTNVATSAISAGMPAAQQAFATKQANKTKEDATMAFLKTLQGGGGSAGAVPTIAPPSTADLSASTMDQYGQNVGMGAGSSAPYQFTSQLQGQPSSNLAYTNPYGRAVVSIAVVSCLEKYSSIAIPISSAEVPSGKVNVLFLACTSNGII